VQVNKYIWEDVKTVWRKIVEFIERIPYKQYFMGELTEAAVDRENMLSYNELLYNTEEGQVCPSSQLTSFCKLFQ